MDQCMPVVAQLMKNGDRFVFVESFRNLIGQAISISNQNYSKCGQFEVSFYSILRCSSSWIGCKEVRQNGNKVLVRTQKSKHVQ
jgi:hypothetical protein